MRIESVDEWEKGLKKLREPFADHQISLKPIPTKKDNLKGQCKECGGYHGLPAVHLKYVGHAALTDRLLEVDPRWFWKPMALTPEGLPLFDKDGGLWIELHICGIDRIGYGNAEPSQYKEIGSREKEVIGDALRNAAMRFGAALDLWHKGDLHGDEEPKPKDPPKLPDKPPAHPQEPYEEDVNFDELPAQPPQQQFPKDTKASQSSKSLITEKQRKFLFIMEKKHHWSDDMVKKHIKDHYGIDSRNELTRNNFDDLLNKMQGK